MFHVKVHECSERNELLTSGEENSHSFHMAVWSNAKSITLSFSSLICNMFLKNSLILHGFLRTQEPSVLPENVYRSSVLDSGTFRGKNGRWCFELCSLCV